MENNMKHITFIKFAENVPSSQFETVGRFALLNYMKSSTTDKINMKVGSKFQFQGRTFSVFLLNIRDLVNDMLQTFFPS